MEAPLAPTLSFSSADAPSAPAAPEVTPRPKKAVPPPPVVSLNARAVAAALSDRSRFRMIEILSTGVGLGPTHFEFILRRDRRALAGHLRVLRRCGLVFEEPGRDGRVRLNRIRPELLKGLEDGHYIIDYGSGVLRVPELATRYESPDTVPV